MTTDIDIYQNLSNNIFKCILTDDPKIFNTIKQISPNISIETIDQFDDDVLRDILETAYGKPLETIIIEKSSEKYLEMSQNITDSLTEEEKIIEENYKIGYENIPEMLLPANLIFLKGKINNIPIKILFDTGASINTIKKSLVEKAGLSYLIDTKNNVNIIGVNSTKKSYGQIWYLDMELQLNNSNDQTSHATVGVCLTVVESDDSEIDVILGIKFMKSYGAFIDFSTNTITINKSIKIKFN